MVLGQFYCLRSRAKEELLSPCPKDIHSLFFPWARALEKEALTVPRVLRLERDVKVTTCFSDM